MTFFFKAESFVFFFGSLLVLTPLLGSYLARIFNSPVVFNSPFLGWPESLCYRITRIDPKNEMSWKEYAAAALSITFLGFVFVFLLQLLQGYLPLNPQHFPGTSWPLAFNTAISFATNTNWQAYSGESTLSYLTQMLGLTVQNFISAATGLAVLMALIRGFVRKSMETIGNYWQDLIRSIVYVLIPLSILFAVLLLGQGVIQSFAPYVEATSLESNAQSIPLGPAASQVAIKQLGTNGGGFFNANSAHPFENPTAVSNFLEALAILLIPAASVYAYGLIIGSKKHGWILFAVMSLLWLGGLCLSLYSEQLHNPLMDAYPLMEGKESRFNLPENMLWSVSTTAASSGSVNNMLSSLTPLAGGVAMLNIMVGELIFGGVGVGLCGMLMFVLMTVFLCGLMVGRTPEYLGKKIEKREMKWVIVAILMPVILILIGAGASCAVPTALASLGNQGPHGLSEILYAFTSCAGNNGSAFAGLNANTDYFNITLGLTMLIGRITILLASLAIAGHLARKKITPHSVGTFSTNSFLFAGLLICVILIGGALAFFPALSLGPLVEHLLMLEGQSF